MEERALVRRAQEGSAEAADRLFQAILPFVMRCAEKKAAYPEHVQEIAQEALTGIYNGLDGFDRNRRLKPWCWAITVNAAARYEKADAVSKQRASELGAALSATRPDDPLDLADLIAVEQAMARLDPEQRELLRLWSWDTPIRKIASRLGQSKSTTHRRIKEALDALRKEMGT